MALRCLFFVQGEGRGHLTQALAMQRLLAEAGHEVVGVALGRSSRRSVPDFFLEKIGAPVTSFESPNFVADEDDRGVRPVKTVLREIMRVPAFWHSLSVLDDAVQAHRPDVVVNFFEPLAGPYALRYRPDVPIVCVAHQYMFHHPDYRFPPGRWINRGAAPLFAHMTAWGADRRLALSLYPAERSVGDPAVLPPLLRDDLYRQPTDRAEPFFLAYILNSGYADEIIRWHRAHPEVPLHCFWDREGADAVERYDSTLTFHQLDDEKFLALMARCRGYVSTSGFESVAEAMYLGKPVQVVPVDGHYEQWCNAFDTVRAGAGIRSRRFNLSELQRFLPHYTHDAAGFRTWVHAGRSRFVEHIEAAAGYVRPVPVPGLAVG